MSLFLKVFTSFTFFYFILFSLNAQQRYTPVRITSTIKLDGKLDESEWQQAIPLDAFMVTDPVAGGKPTERTEVRMLYNDEYLYIGFHCYDSEPDKIVRFFMDRDFELGKDDGISVQLDSYNDKSTAVIFITNTLNGRFDSEISSNGGNMNNDYNNFWDAKSKIDSTGYTTEFKIPFSSLRFEQKEKVVMGFRFARLIKRKNELCTYPRCDSTLQDMWNNVSQSAELEFTNLKTKKPIYLTPYVIGNFNHQYDLNSEGTEYLASNTFFLRKHFSENETIDKILSNAGVDLKYGLTKNFTMNFTVNTDFAQAEVDNRIINLSKYAVNLPEKRNFFLESKNYLSYQVGYGTQLFNSRTIGLQDGSAVPILAGVRITGNQNGLAIGALNMQTTDVKSENIPAENFSAVRFRKFYGKRGSFYGGIFTNRISTNNSSVSNRSIGVDLVHAFNDKWKAGFGVATTHEKSISKTLDNNQFINLFAFKNANEGFTHGFNFEYVGKNFNPAMGFIAEQDYGFIALSNGKRTRINGTGNLNFFNINTELDYRWKLGTGLTETKFANFKPGITWKKGSSIDVTFASYKEDRLFENWQLNDHITVPLGYYHMFTNDINLYYDQSKSYTAGLYFMVGDFYGGRIFNTSASINYIINRYFRIGINYDYNTINFPKSFSDNSNSVYQSNLVSGNLLLTMSSKFSVKLLTQYDDNSNSFSGNLRLRYNPQEGTDLYIVYNSSVNTNRLEAKPALPLIDSQTIIIKYSITFGL